MCVRSVVRNMRLLDSVRVHADVLALRDFAFHGYTVLQRGDTFSLMTMLPHEDPSPSALPYSALITVTSPSGAWECYIERRRCTEMLRPILGTLMRSTNHVALLCRLLHAFRPCLGATFHDAVELDKARAFSAERHSIDDAGQLKARDCHVALDFFVTGKVIGVAQCICAVLARLTYSRHAAGVNWS